MHVTDEMLLPSLEGLNVKQAIDSNRLFKVDLKILTDIPVKSDQYIVSFKPLSDQTNYIYMYMPILH